MEFSVRLPGGFIPTLCKVPVDAVASEAVESLIQTHKQFQRPGCKYSLVVFPNSRAAQVDKLGPLPVQGVLPPHTKLKDLELGKRKIIAELWNSPYPVKLALADSMEQCVQCRVVPLDLTLPLANMIPMLQNLFSLGRSEFCLQCAVPPEAPPLPPGNSEVWTRSFSLSGEAEKRSTQQYRVRWLTTLESLRQQDFPPGGYVIVFPLSLLPKWNPTTPPLKEGFLLTQSFDAKKRDWTPKDRKWCVVRDSFLFIYKKKADTAGALVTIPLEYYNVRRAPPMDLALTSGGSLVLRRHNTGFDVTHRAEVYELFSERSDSREIAAWLELFKPKCVPGARVFGTTLAAAVRDRPTMIPAIVEKTVSYLTERALCTEGLFRISGSLSQVERYKDLFDEGADVSLSECPDHHLVATLLKLYFRELVDPLLCFDLYDHFMAAYRVPEDQRLGRMLQVEAMLPLENSIVLKYLLRFFDRLAQYSDSNKMTHNNIATVFGPNVLRSRAQSMSALVQDSSSVINVFQYLLENYESFPDRTPPPTTIVRRVSVLNDRPPSWILPPPDDGYLSAAQHPSSPPPDASPRESFQPATPQLGPGGGGGATNIARMAAQRVTGDRRQASQTLPPAPRLSEQVPQRPVTMGPATGAALAAAMQEGDWSEGEVTQPASLTDTNQRAQPPKQFMTAAVASSRMPPPPKLPPPPPGKSPSGRAMPMPSHPPPSLPPPAPSFADLPPAPPLPTLVLPPPPPPSSNGVYSDEETPRSPELPPPPAAPVGSSAYLREGYLKKKPADREAQWITRYFRCTDSQLSYFKSSKDVEAKGTFTLAECSFRRITGDKANCFQFDTPVGAFFLRAPSRDEYAAWIQALDKVYANLPPRLDVPSGSAAAGRSPRSPLKLQSPSLSLIGNSRKPPAPHSDSEGEEWTESSEFFNASANSGLAASDASTGGSQPRTAESYEAEIARLKQQLATEAEARKAAVAELRVLRERLAHLESR